MSAAEVSGALKIVEHGMQPAEPKEIIKGLTKARYMTRKGREQQQDEELILAAYTEILLQWPADVALTVLSKFHRLENGWWPSAHAVEEALDFEGGPRKAMHRALMACT